jgi:prefoldin subunit 5
MDPAGGGFDDSILIMGITTAPEAAMYGRELEQSAEELRRELRGMASRLGAVHKELKSYINHASEPASRMAGRQHILTAIDDTIPVLEQQIRELKRAQRDLRNLLEGVDGSD